METSKAETASRTMRFELIFLHVVVFHFKIQAPRSGEFNKMHYGYPFALLEPLLKLKAQLQKSRNTFHCYDV